MAISFECKYEHTQYSWHKENVLRGAIQIMCFLRNMSYTFSNYQACYNNQLEFVLMFACHEVSVFRCFLLWLRAFGVWPKASHTWAHLYYTTRWFGRLPLEIMGISFLWVLIWDPITKAHSGEKTYHILRRNSPDFVSVSRHFFDSIENIYMWLIADIWTRDVYWLAYSYLF